MFIYKFSEKKHILLLKYNNINFFNTSCCVDSYNAIFFNLNGILLWLNVLHINIILIKFSFLILLNNLEYLIIFKIQKFI
uniref:MURF5 n=1 Tax=Leishmania enriettii TaxID=5663 RepID=A0A5H3CIT7_LEIEN|nr:TPA_asm: MURF5 [Leishmania enriettii]